MKTANASRTKNYPCYRPGTGWIGGTHSHRRSSRFRPVPASNPTARLSPLSVAGQRRPGMLTKLVILTCVVAAAVSMYAVFSGL